MLPATSMLSNTIFSDVGVQMPVPHTRSHQTPTESGTSRRGAHERNGARRAERTYKGSSTHDSSYGNAGSAVETSAGTELAPTMPERQDALPWERAETNTSHTHKIHSYIPWYWYEELRCGLRAERLQTNHSMALRKARLTCDGLCTYCLLYTSPSPRD